jgi:O-antigen ligase
MSVQRHVRAHLPGVEYVLVSTMVWGILLLNRSFTHVNFQGIYLTEIVLAVGLLAVATAFVVPPRRREPLAFLGWWDYAPLLLLAAIGAVTLALSWRQGLYAVRQSLIVLYVAFVPLFVAAFDSADRLKRFLHACLIPVSAVIFVKIALFLWIGRQVAGEPYRVAHDDVDVLFSALALIGLFVFGHRFTGRARLLALLLLATNAFVLTCTMKRAAYLGLLAAGAVILTLDRASLLSHWRKLLAAVMAFAVAGALVALFPKDSGGPALQLVAHKLDIRNENNSSWRLEAWRVAADRFRENPVLGRGYGKRILETPVRNVNTADPHNSFLALMVYNGLLGLAALGWVVASAWRSYLETLRHTGDEEVRRLALFLLGGLTLLLVYAFFNVALENQRVALFFWLFIAGAFIVRERPRTAEATAASTWSWRHAAVPTLALLAYLGAVLHPSNTGQAVPIYSPRQGGPLPVLLDPGAQGQEMSAAPDGLTLRLSGSADRQCRLSWTIYQTLDPIVGAEADYAVKVTFREPPRSDVLVHFSTLGGEQVTPERRRVEGNVVTVALGDLRGVSVHQLADMVLAIGHRLEPSTLTIERVELVHESGTTTTRDAADAGRSRP